MHDLNSLPLVYVDKSVLFSSLFTYLESITKNSGLYTVVSSLLHEFKEQPLLVQELWDFLSSKSSI